MQTQNRISVSTAADIAQHYKLNARSSGGYYRIPCPAHRGDDDNLAIKDGDQGGLILPSRDWYDRRGEEISLDFLLRPVPAVSATPGERLADPVAEPETLVAFIAETTPGGGVIAQMALTVLVFWLYMTAKLPESTWGASSAASSFC